MLDNLLDLPEKKRSGDRNRSGSVNQNIQEMKKTGKMVVKGFKQVKLSSVIEEHEESEEDEQLKEARLEWYQK